MAAIESGRGGAAAHSRRPGPAGGGGGRRGGGGRKGRQDQGDPDGEHAERLGASPTSPVARNGTLVRE